MQITKQDTMGVRRSLNVELVVDVALDNQERWRKTHEVLDSDEDLVSDDMLAAAGRTPASEG